jgi:hypothetical protein
MQVLPQTKSLTCPCDHHRCRDSVNCICRTSVTASTTSGTIRALARRAKLFTDGNDDSDVFYKVVSGTVCTYKILNDGRRQITDFHSESEYFGLEMGIGQSLGHAVVDTKLSVFIRDRLKMPCPGDAESSGTSAAPLLAARANDSSGADCSVSTRHGRALFRERSFSFAHVAFGHRRFSRSYDRDCVAYSDAS